MMGEHQDVSTSKFRRVWKLLGILAGAAIAILAIRKIQTRTTAKHQMSEDELDAALEMTFPASDPPAL
jgi:hypothetical protein